MAGGRPGVSSCSSCSTSLARPRPLPFPNWRLTRRGVLVSVVIATHRQSINISLTFPPNLAALRAVSYSSGSGAGGLKLPGRPAGWTGERPGVVAGDSQGAGARGGSPLARQPAPAPPRSTAPFGGLSRPPRAITARALHPHQRRVVEQYGPRGCGEGGQCSLSPNPLSLILIIIIIALQSGAAAPHLSEGGRNSRIKRGLARATLPSSGEMGLGELLLAPAAALAPAGRCGRGWPRALALADGGGAGVAPLGL
jgi:hypothetical protein